MAVIKLFSKKKEGIKAIKGKLINKNEEVNEEVAANPTPPTLKPLTTKRNLPPLSIGAKNPTEDSEEKVEVAVPPTSQTLKPLTTKRNLPPLSIGAKKSAEDKDDKLEGKSPENILKKKAIFPAGSKPLKKKAFAGFGKKPLGKKSFGKLGKKPLKKNLKGVVEPSLDKKIPQQPENEIKADKNLPTLKTASEIPKNNNVSHELQEKTANIPAYEKTFLRELKPALNNSSESLFCFFKTSDDKWERKHYLPTVHGVRIGGVDSLFEISLNDSDLDSQQVVIKKIAEQWTAMDIGENDMMRVDSFPSRNVIIAPNLPFLLQIGSEAIIIFLSTTRNAAPNLLQPEEGSNNPLSNIEFGNKKFPLLIPKEIPDGEERIITTLPNLGFNLTPVNNPDGLFNIIKIESTTTSLDIGRSSKVSEQIILDTSVSRKHAEITVQNKSIMITDYDTSNGTFINSEEISIPTAAKPGDIVTFGCVPFILSY